MAESRSTASLLTRLVAVTVPAALLLAPAVAHAGRAVVRDATHDVARDDEDASEAAGHDVTRPAPGMASGDITRVVVDHGTDVLEVTVHVRDLRDDFVDMAHLRLRTPQSSWTIDTMRTGRETYTQLSRGAREIVRQCGGLLTEVDRAADAIVVVVPTACLRDPRWVRVGVSLMTGRTTHDPHTGDDVSTFLDEAGVDGFHGDREPLLGPKVPRG